MALSASLNCLTDREAITDTLYRCATGVDIPDSTLFNSAFTDDAVMIIGGRTLVGREAIQTGCYDPISRLDTTHYLTNVRISYVDGASEAAVTASVLSQHYRPGEGTKPGTTSFLAGGFYFVDVVKDDKDGLWKAKHWELKVVWRDGDAEIMA